MRCGGLLALGLAPGDKVALYLRNVPEYVEAVAACFKARLVHVNVNYRYLDEELRYLFDNSDSAVVVFAAEFGDAIERLRPGLPKLRALVQVGEGDGRARGVEAYEALAGAGDGSRLDLARSPDDLLFLYTGGTTGMPKGVMWRHEDLFEALGRGANALNGNRRPADLAAHRDGVRAAGGGVRQLPACPLMHGTGLFTAIGAILGGGSVVTLPSARFDPGSSRAPARSRSATTRTPRRPRRRSAASAACGTRSRATGAPSTPTERSSSSAAAAYASTPPARRSTPRRSRKC